MAELLLALTVAGIVAEVIAFLCIASIEACVKHGLESIIGGQYFLLGVL